MLSQEEFYKIIKIVNTANNRLDCLMNSVDHKDFMTLPEHRVYHKEWLMAIQDDLGKLTDYLVDEVKIEEETK